MEHPPQRQPNADHWARGALQAASVVAGGIGGQALGGPVGMILGAALGGAAATQIPHFKDPTVEDYAMNTNAVSSQANPGPRCEPVPGDAGDAELAKGFYDGAHGRADQSECSFLPSVYRQGYAEGSRQRSANPAAPSLPPGIFLDVRTPAEQAQGIIPGALTIQLERIPRAMWHLLTATNRGRKPVYVYCRRGKRSKVATDYLRQLGFTAYDLGGIENGTAKSIYTAAQQRRVNPLAPVPPRAPTRPARGLPTSPKGSPKTTVAQPRPAAVLFLKRPQLSFVPANTALLVAQVSGKNVATVWAIVERVGAHQARVTQLVGALPTAWSVLTITPDQLVGRVFPMQ